MIGMLAAFHFIRPVALILLLPAFLLWWLQRWRSDTTQRWRRVIDPELLPYLVVTPRRAASNATPSAMLLCGWALATVAVAGPTWRVQPSPFADVPPPAMIVLRVTPSMEADDLAPTRLERAKQKIADLLELRQGGATGLVAYGGSAHMVLPPTADTDVVLTMAQALSPSIMPRDGDRLADALTLANRALADDPRRGAIVLLADTVAPDQVAALRGKGSGPNRAPVVWLSMAPPARADADPNLLRAAEALDADLADVTPDRNDVSAVANRLARADRLTDIAGQGERWQDLGYWLTPLVTFLVLGGFRRGWVVFT
jgi:Ca-activated chloride channel family protein